MKAFIAGGVNIDNIKLPERYLKEVIGGSAVYASIASSLFCATKLGGVTGNDYPKGLLQTLEKRGIDLSLLQKSTKKSFRWTARYSDDLSQLTVVQREIGASGDLDVSKMKGGFEDVGTAFIGKIQPEEQLELINILPKNATVIVESWPPIMISKRAELQKVLAKADVLLISREEASLLFDIEPPVPELIERIMEMGPKIVVYKKGEHGLTMYGRTGTMIVPPYPLVYAVDPTGAGDVLGGSIAGVLTRLGELNETNMKAALLLASTMSSFTVEGYGVEKLMSVTMDEVLNRTKIFLQQLPCEHDLPIDLFEK